MSGAIATRSQRSLTTVDDALRRILDHVAPLPTERVAIGAALGRVLAEDVQAAHALPGCDNSAMDGFAVRAADCRSAPLSLPVAAESRAGMAPPRHSPGTATRISTGAPLPAGADSVIPLEMTDDNGVSVTLHVSVDDGSNVRRVGEDARPGDLMVHRGARLRAVDIGVLAAAGRHWVEVHRRPVVAVIAGGDELVAAGSAPLPHQVTDSNTPLLAAAIREAGGEPLAAAHAADDRDAVRNALHDAASRSDLVLSSAGVSVGGHDHVCAVVEELGEVMVWGVAMRPGKPLLAGRLGGTTVLGLPGNPVSAAVCFEVFARPALLALQGATTPVSPRVAVRTAETIEAPRRLETYVRVALQPGNDGVPLARPSGGQGSAMLRPLAAADALLIVPAGIDHIVGGNIATAIPLR